MKSFNKQEFYAILSSAISQALAEAAPDISPLEREARSTTIAARTAQRFYESIMEESNV
jgi:hypothetical protein